MDAEAAWRAPQPHAALPRAAHPRACHTLGGQLKEASDSSDCAPLLLPVSDQVLAARWTVLPALGGVHVHSHPCFPGAENGLGLGVHSPGIAMSSNKVTLTPGQRKAPDYSELIMNALSQVTD